MTRTIVMETKNRCEDRILSGQFMVSHFEQEAEDYIDDCEGIDCSDSSLVEAVPSLSNVASTSSSAACTALALYKPKEPEKRIAEVYEIDSDLSKIFDTLNVTYK